MVCGRRRRYLGRMMTSARAALLLALPIISCTAVPNNLSGKRPNILFIFSDDHAYQAISAYGSNRNTTPNIDRIARSGMRFDRCYVTNSICGPSRAVILTGRYSHLNGVRTNGNRFDGTQQTFPKMLRKAGYATALFGKWHLKTKPTGFDQWAVLPGQGHYYNPDFRTSEGGQRIAGYVTDIITDKALGWLQRGRDNDKPFLLMVQHKAPHREWEPPLKHLNLYDGEEIPEPATLFDDYANRASPAAGQQLTIARHLQLGPDLKVWTEQNKKGSTFKRTYGRMTAEQRQVWDAAYQRENNEFVASKLEGEALVRRKYQRYIKDYLRCIASVDDNVGRLLDYLEAHDLAKDTIVVYSSDQGFYLGEHGWYDKRWMYEESLRTPLLVRWPGVVTPGSSNADIVSNLDFAETFLAIARAPQPVDMQGRSLTHILKGRRPSNWRADFYYHFYEAGAFGVPAHYGVTDGTLKLIHYYRYRRREIDEWELFDLSQDPQELRSVYADPGYAQTVLRMKKRLQDLRQELGVEGG